MSFKSKRSKLTDISTKVKEIVYERDGGRCIICGLAGLPNAHYIPRSKSGLGIEENVVTLCIYHHQKYDNGYLREEIGNSIREYLKSKYGDSWSEEKLTYNKWENFKFNK